jgi:NAD(P)-dependent dehydrogenase (short-subunit alcohol dehydrogenase family)
VAPGPVRGPRLSALLAADPASEAEMIARTPAGRLAELGDVAAAVLFLCAARHVTGQTLVIDGGWTASAWWGRHAAASDR